jgi:hypothetical protein
MGRCVLPNLSAKTHIAVLDVLTRRRILTRATAPLLRKSAHYYGH